MAEVERIAATGAWRPGDDPGRRQFVSVGPLDLDVVRAFLHRGPRERVGGAEVAHDVKGASSRWMNEQAGSPEEQGFRWQGRYGAFSVSPHERSRVVSYIEYGSAAGS